jgi:hypothetical protein
MVRAWTREQAIHFGLMRRPGLIVEVTAVKPILKKGEV